jgi:3-methyladenine DNA glycosylase AlkD
MTIDAIRAELFALQDLKYRDFQSKLLPTVDKATIIGVRTPALRNLAKNLAQQDALAKKELARQKDHVALVDLAQQEGIDAFMEDLPHRYFDENQLHAFLLSGQKDFHHCVEGVCRFLPFVDNWATCDQMSPKVFKKHRQKLLDYIQQWIRSDATYTIRFGVGMLMEHFLDEDFRPEYLETVASLRSEEYYVNMMIAWYFATALAKQYDEALPYIQDFRLEPWTHNKAIQKSIESNRIIPEQKAYLKTLKVKVKR